MKQTIRRRLNGNVSPDGLGRLTLTRGDSYALELGLFEADGSTPADLENVISLYIEFYNYEGASDQLVDSVLVKASNLNLTMSKAQWDAGTHQSATFALTSDQTEIAFSGEARVRMIWGVVYGLLWDGDRRTYGAGHVMVRRGNASGSMGVLSGDEVFLRDDGGDPLFDEDNTPLKTNRTA